MERIKIGIPKGLPYYYYNLFWQYFFEKLDVDVEYSCDTNKEILMLGNRLANDEMCLSLKIFLGHAAYLKDRCDYLLLPRIENYGDADQTCTNFLGLYDLVHNLIDVNILDYNISNRKNELESLIDTFAEIDIDTNKIMEAYQYAKEKEMLDRRQKEQNQELNLNNNANNILIISHPYNTYDAIIGQPIIKLLRKYTLNPIYCDLFDPDLTNEKGHIISPNLYWKYCKENIGSILLAKNITGIIFLSSFPCGLDSLVNEYLMRKINKPYLNLIIDDMDSLTGMETRIESFADIVTQN